MFVFSSIHTLCFSSTYLEQVIDVVHVLRDVLKTTQFVSSLARTLLLQATCEILMVRKRTFRLHVYIQRSLGPRNLLLNRVLDSRSMDLFWRSALELVRYTSSGQFLKVTAIGCPEFPGEDISTLRKEENHWNWF